MWRALLRAVAGVCVLAVGGLLAYFVFTAVNGPIGVPTTSTTPNAGQAATQFGSVGFTLRVAGLSRTPDQVVLKQAPKHMWGSACRNRPRRA